MLSRLVAGMGDPPSTSLQLFLHFSRLCISVEFYSNRQWTRRSKGLPASFVLRILVRTRRGLPSVGSERRTGPVADLIRRALQHKGNISGAISSPFVTVGEPNPRDRISNNGASSRALPCSSAIVQQGYEYRILII